MAEPPRALQEIVEEFRDLDRTERAEMLIEYADQFQEVPPRIATRPFPEEHRVVRCESQAYVWAEDLPDGTLKFHFAVENPQGLSAKSWAAIMDQTLSGQPLEQVVQVAPDVIFDIYGNTLSMGKGEGLMGMLAMVTHAARQRLAARRAAAMA